MGGLGRRDKMIGPVHIGGSLAAVRNLEVGIKRILGWLLLLLLLLHDGIEESLIGILVLGLLDGDTDLLEGFGGGEVGS